MRTILIRNPQGKRGLGRLGADGRIILTWMLDNSVCGCELESNG